jgi:hypothetical protein
MISQKGEKMDMCISSRIMAAGDWTLPLQWLKEYYGRDFPRTFFPETGIITSMGEQPACVIPVYLENTANVAVLGHCMFNNSMPKRLLAAAARQCIDSAKNFAVKHQKKYVISIFGRNSINRIADKCGFLSADIVEEKIYIAGGK